MQKISIGRHPTSDIFFINDNSVSKNHAEIVVEDSGTFVRDLNSLNGTFINGLRIYGTQALKEYDILKVGNSLVPWKNYITPQNLPQHNGAKVQNAPSDHLAFKVNNIPSVSDWMLNLFLVAIPIVGLVLLIVWANDDNEPVKKNFAKATLWWALILLIFYFFLFLFLFNRMRY